MPVTAPLGGRAAATMPKEADWIMEWKDRLPPILEDKRHDEVPTFRPENLLREGRRQRGVEPGDVPAVCLLDPDGDIVDWLLERDRARPSPYWACYHTTLYTFDLDGRTCGVIGNAVGASFAVLLAEQLFVSGCELLVSITSAGRIADDLEPPCFLLIDRALRDEGTSYHYLPPADFSRADDTLLGRLDSAYSGIGFSVRRGATWTTDAPYRETETAIAANRRRGIAAVEMEAAALYAFAEARQRSVICFAHITNQMARDGDDFEKGEGDGAPASLAVLKATVDALVPSE